ncbi:hypothetical protein MBLNU230_g5444t1 [Neophaeotheca triangularis]
MPSSSARSSINSRRVPSAATQSRMQRHVSYAKRAPPSDHDAYIWALRSAFLAYLLQPRQKRIQHVANTSKPIQRSSTSINDLVKDFSLIRDSKSTKFPHGFMAALDKRITGVLVGQERMPEYADSNVKRTFANFLNEFKNPTFRKSMEKDRRVEDLLLIFYSKATSELQKGKAREDDGWKMMVDRHVALFVRLISNTLKQNDWARERPELGSRLHTLETKLLQHDQDLATSSGQQGSGGQTTIEVEVPRSYEVRDMPLVVRICRIFAIPTAQAQNDINAHKGEWTERAALKDLKDYQNHMMLNTRVTLSKDDFDTDEAFETWRKGEFSDLSQMMLAILQSNPELAKNTPGASLANFKPPSAVQNDSTYGDASRRMSGYSTEGDSSYVIDQPVDMSGLNLGESSPQDSGAGAVDEANFTFIPSDPRAYYKQILKTALTHDLQDEDLQPSSATDEGPAIKLISPQSLEMLNELAVRWRIPAFSRLVLFIDAVKDKYISQETDLDTLDAAFCFVKEEPQEAKKGQKANPTHASMFDRSLWTIQDFALDQSILSALHDALLRELFELLQHCYDSKAPGIGPIMYVLDAHIYHDELFTRSQEDRDAFGDMLRDALRQEARTKYHEMLAKHVDDDAKKWEFFSVIQLGQSVVALCEKIQKRYRKNPEVMGVKPLPILVEEILPSFAADARDMVSRIIELAHERGEEVPIQDGFDLYKELVAIRQVHAQALPGVEFAFHIEGLLQAFVWRWLATMDEKMIDWCENAVKSDNFTVRPSDPNESPTDDERHSQSVIDIYRLFNQTIDQIAKLEWDDDLQYAKFMTAVSKSIGKGLARYCEMLDLRFAKEMDRATPEQEAAAQRTQKEKWMAMARDTWQQRDKIEPFHFFPESFVKLNNVEYATLQLDKLEREANVDACAEVISRLEPPPAPTQRLRGGGNKYVFTIKIIEAEDLKACDMNGLSDPYVVLGDEYQKRLAKTRIVYGSLNPRWDETVDITTTGPLNIISTIWDWDTLGDHDCVGRTSLKLDPNHFNDYMPREYWLDLDTQGRLLVRVSMEGERDDIQFYFGKAFRTLKRTERDMTRKITDKLSAYIHQCLSKRTLKQLTTGTTLAGISVSSMRGYFSKATARQSSGPNPSTPSATAADVGNALKPLTDYFDDNFAIMKLTLTDSAMITVMTRLWKEVLSTLEALLVPPLSDKPSAQRPLTQQEVDIVYKWLSQLFDFFHAYDDDSRVALGVPLDVLKSPKYHDLQNLAFFYPEPTDNLIRTSESMAAASASRQAELRSSQPSPTSPLHNPRASAPPHLGPAASNPLAPSNAPAKSKSILLSRNLGTIRQTKAAKRQQLQAEPSDDIILRILRMRPEAERYLRDRSRQRERLAAQLAAEDIVRQSLRGRGIWDAAGGGRGSGGGAGAGAGGDGGAGGRKGGGARRWDTIRA